MKTSVAGLLAILFLLGACGTSPDRGAASGAAGSGPSGPEEPVSTTPDPGGDVAGGSERPQQVRPRPGMDNLRPVAWDKARPSADGDLLLVTYWSGVEPCNVLDHVDVRFHENTIEVTLYEGNDPAEPDTACIEIALLKAVKVRLDEPVNGRKIVDGAR